MTVRVSGGGLERGRVVSLVLLVALLAGLLGASTPARAQPRAVWHDEDIAAPMNDENLLIPAPQPLSPALPGAGFSGDGAGSLFDADEGPQALPNPQAEQELRHRLRILQAQARQLEAASKAQGRATVQQAAQAALELGLIHLHGSGVPVDAGVAQQWFEQALALQPQGRAVGAMAWCYLQGCQLPPDADAAREMITRLRGIQPGRAAFLEWALALQQSPLIMMPAPRHSGGGQRLQVPQPALLREAARAGDVHAHVELGIDAFNQGQETQARAHFRAAAHGSPAARANLTMLDAVRQRQQQGGAAAQAGGRELEAAHRAHRGTQGPANYSEALRLYRLAAQQGNAAARNMLQLILSRPAADGGINVVWMRELALMDFSGELPQLAAPVSQPQLQRDPTPLFDWLPAYWQERATLRGLLPGD
ncbi:hypothetical protein D8I35_07850 [Corticibacter populi]|uniref:Sel1 repeat family protein n=1 Tax=Corticibacter populi TaxID=1550736 RepID=A0A3M6QTU4_9BURK|nr:SEL1-like repeat protein [Corticibacter populi]RMX06437.1 hypothetical protein D8I35_07850 [Corticibacter populi]